MHKIKLFFLVCILCGLCSVLGSMLCNKLAKPYGVFIGAFMGGVTGIVLSYIIALRYSLFKKGSYNKTALFSIIGFLLASVVSYFNLHFPLVVISSTTLIGLGAVFGS